MSCHENKEIDAKVLFRLCYDLFCPIELYEAVLVQYQGYERFLLLLLLYMSLLVQCSTERTSVHYTGCTQRAIECVRAVRADGLCCCYVLSTC